jgi:hypothetical protein
MIEQNGGWLGFVSKPWEVDGVQPSRGGHVEVSRRAFHQMALKRGTSREPSLGHDPASFWLAPTHVVARRMRQPGEVQHIRLGVPCLEDGFLMFRLAHKGGLLRQVLRHPPCFSSVATWSDALIY